MGKLAQIDDTRIEEIADHYGWDAQSRQTIEEMAELTEAINKFWRKILKCGRATYLNAEDFRRGATESREMKDLISEMADVEVCMLQMRYMLDMDEQIEAGMEDKIRRQLCRINMGD